MSIRIVLADDHSVVLQGMKAYLDLEPGMEVVCLCADGVEATEAVAEHRPDVVVMDLTMPRRTGIEAYEMLKAEGLAAPTVLLTATLDDDTLVRCLRAGVEGLVLKDSAAEKLVDAIREVAAGDRWIPQALALRATELLSRPSAEDEEEALTAREKEVVLLVASGAPNKRVAADLGIAESTVKLHLHSAFAKLQVSNRTQLSLLARERGWI